MITEPKNAKRTVQIIFDSNAFFVPLKFKIDVFDELRARLNMNFEAVLLSPILRELEKLANASGPKRRKEGVYALRLAKKCKLIDVDTQFSGSPDDVIAKAAEEWNSMVFTNDRQLRKRLRNINVPVIYVRQKSRLEIEGRT
jgi:hypothetical protein